MLLSKEKTAECVRQYQRGPNDTGSLEVQIALLTERIRALTEHLKVHPKDLSTKHGLTSLVNQRKLFLSKLKSESLVRYKTLIDSLKLRS